MVDANDSQSIKELSPGAMLLQGRLQAGLTQEQVAKELYMTVYKVKALEADDYKRLNSDTFARGYIRAYANLVKLDVTAVLAAYDKLLEELNPQPAVSAQAAAAETGHRGAWQFLIVIAAFFAGLWLISVWFFDNRSEAQYVIVPEKLSPAVSTKVQPSALAAPATAGQIVTDSSSSAEADKTNMAAVTAASLGSAVAANSKGAQTSSAIVQSASSANGNVVKKTVLDELDLSFRAESWLEVSDSRGDVLATELQPRGSNIKLVGVAPFDVKLGNAPAVDIQLNGKKIDVIPLVGSNVLVLKVGN